MFKSLKSVRRTTPSRREPVAQARVAPAEKALAQPTPLDDQQLKQVSGGNLSSALPKGGW